jgi:hypothetical protein
MLSRKDNPKVGAGTVPVAALSAVPAGR